MSLILGPSGARFQKSINVFCLTLLIASGCIRVLYPVVVIVHGSFAVTKAWWRPGGYFFNIVEEQAKTLGHKVVPFAWSGKPTDQEIRQAGQNLLRLLVSYPPQERIILIGHSHGGNIINVATNLLNDYVKEVFATSKPQTALQAMANFENPETSILQNGEPFDLSATTKKQEIVNPVNPLVTVPILISYPIEKIYLLGTPVSTKYMPSMGVVGALINLFSEGDLIQPVVGLYSRCYPLQDRLSNIQVALWEKEKVVNPGHSALHNSVIARWILHIPERLVQTCEGNFNQFCYAANGHILFSDKDCPIYCVRKELNTNS